jgi:hypothetical protein
VSIFPVRELLVVQQKDLNVVAHATRGLEMPLHLYIVSIGRNGKSVEGVMERRHTQRALTDAYRVTGRRWLLWLRRCVEVGNIPYVALDLLFSRVFVLMHLD